ncbi:hypothetical protein [Pseudomonas izuensis]|uniref:hypothetical protein n=1 Tax=Pseudomonas izuensis TaxID=2684212 RepID=UPI00135C8A0B|nr:hypothetical protein [Pseudomonas izuensis]
MKLPLPTYKNFINLYAIGEALHMFVNQIDEAIKTLTADGVQFHTKNHMIQLIMREAKMFPCEESFKDVETYLGDGADALLRDFGVAHHG